VHKEILEHKEIRVLKVILEPKEIQEHKAIQVPKVFKVHLIQTHQYHSSPI